MSNINIYNQDCMEAMKSMPDKAYELAIVDPPYGINIAKEKPRVSGRWNYTPRKWDEIIPDKVYFSELNRVSENQIIWGGNYFNLPATRCMVIWDKQQPVENFADCEIAWTSFNQVARIFRMSFAANKFKIHITQKPVALYQWLLKNYAKPGDKILDTHGGSCSIAIACDIMGFDADIYEIDEDYYKAAVERFERHKQQAKLEF